MKCKDIKTQYQGLQHRRDKLVHKRTWLHKRLGEVKDAELICKLTEEDTQVNNNIIEVGTQLSHLEHRYSFLKLKEVV